MLRSLVGSEMCIRDSSVSNNRRMSGTLPSQLGSAPALKVVLANGMSLSGTLPAFANASIITLSLARNYLVGDIGTLASQRNLRTLVLSSNHLSCRTPVSYTHLTLPTKRIV
eukprot:TRINITY_DN13768_c0_g1_i1.p2 TRINITY_DN13768_c0_g1~~TRINITY_DN13768_c0_g1_i1.p2  ORF type:complete len:112 (+),score=27.36 TRINITY_DN13768_c0_g1_i1:110-445(+)